MENRKVRGSTPFQSPPLPFLTPFLSSPSLPSSFLHFLALFFPHSFFPSSPFPFLPSHSHNLLSSSLPYLPLIFSFVLCHFPFLLALSSPTLFHYFLPSFPYTSSPTLASPLPFPLRFSSAFLFPLSFFFSPTAHSLIHLFYLLPSSSLISSPPTPHMPLLVPPL